MALPPFISAANLILSPAFSLPSQALSATPKAMVIGGMPMLSSWPCWMTISPAALSIFLTVPSLSGAAWAAAADGLAWCCSKGGQADGEKQGEKQTHEISFDERMVALSMAAVDR